MTPDPHPHDLLGQQDGVLAEWIGVGIRASTITPEWIVAALREEEGGSR